MVDTLGKLASNYSLICSVSNTYEVIDKLTVKGHPFRGSALTPGFKPFKERKRKEKIQKMFAARL